MEIEPKNCSFEPPEQELPEVDRNVIVYTKRFRCLGHRDFAGRWVDISSREISNVIGWEPV